MTVVIDGTLTNPNFPRFCYNNLLIGSTVTASTEASGFAKENVLDALTDSFWKPTAQDSNIAFTLSTSTAINYVAIAAHNCGTQGNTVVAQYLDSSLSLVTTVQEFNISIADTAATGTDTLSTSIDKSLSAVFVTGIEDAGTIDDFDRSLVTVELTNSTTVTATRVATDTAIANISGYIVTFSSDYVTEVHHGTVNVAVSTTTGTSSSFDATLANCAVLFCGSKTDDPGDSYNASLLNLTLSGSDGAVTVTATREAASGTISPTASFNIIECVASKVNQIQESVVTMTNGNATGTDTITAVDLSKSLALFGGCRTSTTTSTDSAFARYDLTNTTTITGNRVDTSGSSNGTVTVIEFNDAVFTSVERVSSAFGSGETTDNVTLSTTLTDTSTAFISKLGFSYNQTTLSAFDPSTAHSTTLITSTTNVANVRAVASSILPTNSYEVYQSSTGSWTTIDSTTPTDNSPIVFLFDSVSSSQYRMQFTGGSVPGVGVIYMGTALVGQRAIYGGFTPITMSKKTVLRPQKSEGGNWLGRSKIRQGVQFNIAMKNLTASWVHTSFKPFINDVIDYPFFFAWRPTSYPSEVAYCWTAKDIQPRNTGQADLMEVSFTVDGKIE